MRLSTLKDIHWRQAGGECLFSLLILVVVLDPTNTVLHLKDIVFVGLVGYNMVCFKPDVKYLPHILTVYAVVLAGAVLGEMQGTNVDEEMLIGTLKGFSPLVLLLWVRQYDVIRLTYVPVLIVSVLFTLLYLLVCSNELIEIFVFEYVRAHNKMIMMTHRSFLGVKVFGMYYKSIISFVFALYFFYYNVWNEKHHRIRNALACFFLTFSFVVSGTRATMLLPFAMLGFVAYRSVIHRPKVRYFLFPLLAAFAVAFLILVGSLAGETGESSNMIKYGHLTSYALLFENHPECLFFGQGPGAVFYSEGFHNWVSQTEWTYLELLRNYGLLALGIIVILLIPLCRLWRYRSRQQVVGMMGAYVAFLLVAGTNPLLVSSTGMIVILAIYSYTEKVEARYADETVQPASAPVSTAVSP